MSSENSNYFTKENLNTYLKELGKEYKKINGKSMPAEIILIGGAAILANYGFREMTTDVDAVIHAVSSMKEAVNHVGDKYNLPNGWLNADFMKTDSYSSKLDQYSVYYREFSNVLTVRTVSAEYLIAMKLCSGRKYKKDLSDVIGILAEHEKRGEPITMDRIDKAVTDLYGSWDKISEDSKNFIQEAMEKGNFEEAYAEISAEETKAKGLLINFEQDYPGVTNTANVNDILKSLKKKKEIER
ncbi:MAG: hypothetical protein J6C34_07085 [Oscillospiraceae bacterium]|nr:hypothetical protein [Oscillospiraceae bacterium]